MYRHVIVFGPMIGHVVLIWVRDHVMSHVLPSQGHVPVLGHVIGHVVLIWVRDHVMSHVLPSQGHVPVSPGHVEESSSSLFGYSWALGVGWVNLGVLCVIPS